MIGEVRVAVVNDWWFPDLVGGAERSALELSRNLSSQGFQVQVFIPDVCDKSELSADLRVNRVRVVTPRSRHRTTKWRKGLDAFLAIMIPRTRIRLVAAVEAFSPAVLILHNTARIGPWFAANIKERLPNIVILHVHHDLSDLCWRRSMLRGQDACSAPCFDCRAKVRISARSHENVDHCIAVSEFVATRLQSQRLVGQATVSVGYPLTIGVDRAPVKSCTGELRVGFLGRLSWEKGADLAVHAVALASESRSVSLVVAGEGDQRYLSLLKQRASASDAVITFCGPATPEEIAREVDLVVVPSRWPEPFGRVPLEFAALGVPTLVFPMGGLPETSRLAPSLIHVLSEPSVGCLAVALQNWDSTQAWSVGTDTQVPKLSGVVAEAIRASLSEEL